jgi:hypothetical protein
VELATAVMEELKLSLRPNQLAGAQQVGTLVDLLVTHSSGAHAHPNS